MDRENAERQVKDKAQSLIGRIKEGFNKMFGSHDGGQIRQRADELRSRASEAGSKIKESATQMKSEVGEKLGKEKQDVEGRVKNLENKTQQHVHR